MKKNIYTAFDEMEENFDFIDESSISQDTEFDKQRIKDGVFSELEMKKHKKKSHRKIMFTLIAAVLILTVMSSTVVAENVPVMLNSFFGGYSYMADNILNAEDVQINVKDKNLNVRMGGILGDEHALYMELILTRKDGKAFVNEEYNIAKCGVLDLNLLGNNKEKVFHSDLTLNFYEEDWQKNNYGVSFNADYSLEDNNRTLKMLVLIEYVGSDFDNADIWDNKHLTIESKKFAAGKVDKVLKTFDNIDTQANIEMSETPFFAYNLFDNTLNYNDVRFNGKTFDYYKGRYKTVHIPFEISLRLKHLSDSKKIRIDDRTASEIFGNAETDCVMSISPVRLSVTAKNDGTHNGESVRRKSNECVVIMNDGNQYYMSSTNTYYSDKDTVMNLEYHTFCDNRDTEQTEEESDKIRNYNNDYDKIIILDYEKIEQIIINGVTVYHR